MPSITIGYSINDVIKLIAEKENVDPSQICYAQPYIQTEDGKEDLDIDDPKAYEIFK